MVAHVFNLGTRRQRQVDLHEFEVSLIYKKPGLCISGPRALERDPVSKEQN